MFDHLISNDFEALQGLFFIRVAGIAQLAALYWHGDESLANRRMLALMRMRFIRVRDLHIGGAQIFCLSRQGFDLLLRRDLLPRSASSIPAKALWRRLEVSDMTILHELAVVDLKVAFETLSPRSISAKLQSWLPGLRILGEDGIGRVPDGLLEVKDSAGQSQNFFLEVDRGTETMKRLLAKAEAYATHSEQGRHAMQVDRLFPFRVLVIVPSVERRNNIAASLSQSIPAHRNLIWIATHGEVVKVPYGAIWMTPADYLKLGEAIPTLPGLGDATVAYRRSKSRDQAIEAGIAFRRLL